MGKKLYFVELLNSDSNTCIREQLPSPVLNYQFIVDLIQSVCPQIDLQTLTIYYLFKQKWLFLLDDDKFNLEENSNDFQKQNREELVFNVRFHCYHFLEKEQESHLAKDIEIMSQKVKTVQHLYRELKDKYKQQPLDINVFWGSPLFDKGEGQRSYLQKEMLSLEGKKLTLLNQQIKYAPFINAVTTALDGCNKNVHLFLKQLNRNSFSQKNIFTVVYLIAHLETDEENDKEKKICSLRDIDEKRQRNFFNSEQFDDFRNEEEENKKTSMKKNANKDFQPSIHVCPPKMKKDVSDKEGSEIQMVIEETDEILENLSRKEDTFGQKSQIQLGIKITSMTAIERYYRLETTVEKEGKHMIDFGLRSSSSFIQTKHTSKQKYESRSKSKGKKIQNNNEENKKWYFLGQEPDGSMCKLRPSQLGSLLSKKSRNIELLILHTSYPYHHLQELRKHANNIILINSNPLFPEASTIFYLKQLFAHLLEAGNIEQAYNRALQDLNTLKQMNFSSNEKSLDKEFTKKDVQFIKSINQKYVHGSLDCCCCYHQHHSKCHSLSNNTANKYAEYHNLYHSLQCECPIESLNIHTCEPKRQIMTHDYKILAPQYELNESKFYYCCCQGKEQGFYHRNFNNVRLEKQFSFDQEKDIHSLKHKYNYQRTMNIVGCNQLQIKQGRLLGDCNPELLEAIHYVENYPLIGNHRLIIRMLQIFTRNRKANDEQMVMCNLYGEKSTGCKTIAHYFGNLLLIKKIYKRLVFKIFRSSDSLKDIIQSTYQQGSGNPLLILIQQDKSHPTHRFPLKLNASHFVKGTGIIIITKVKIEDNLELKMKFVEPQPFQKTDCINFVKKYRHLNSIAKKKVQKLFKLNKMEVSLYPCLINQFQILSILKKTVFDEHPLLGGYRTYANALDRMNSEVLPIYVFMMSLIKFTKSPQYLKDCSMPKINQKLTEIKRNKKLFYKEYNTKLEQNQYNQMQNRNIQEQMGLYYQDLIATNRIRDNYYLIYLCLGDKLVSHIGTIFKMFINYTTILQPQSHHEESKIRKKVECLRMKRTPLCQQVYETTTINPDSYIVRYFSRQLSQIEKISINHQNLYDLEDFIYSHASILEQKRTPTRKLTNDFHINIQSKDRYDKRILQHSLDITRERVYSEDYTQKEEKIEDIPHIHHLASVIQGGLQCLRSVLCTHFVYNLLNESQRIDLLKYGMLLINNCIILMKNQNFAKIQQQQDQYDIDFTDQELRDSLFTQNLFHSTHNLEVPNLTTMKSAQTRLPPQAINRAASMNSQNLFNTHRILLKAEKSSSKLPDEQEVEFQTNEELLSKQLYRLSTYKGLLYLLAEIERRAEEIEIEDVIRIKIQIQLMAIQIKLEQLQLFQEEKHISQTSQDHHLARLSQIFNQKNYNLNVLYKILRQQILLGRLSQDISQLSMIKSYIIVGLSLMSSHYGRFKIVKAASMINEIDMFLLDWNYIPLHKRESQQEGNEQCKLELSKMKNLPSQFKLMRFISENEYVYLYIVCQSFSSTKFWRNSFKKIENVEKQMLLTKQDEPSKNSKLSAQLQNPDQIEVYLQILQFHHIFILPNTKNKFSYYKKLEYIQQKLRKQKEGKSFRALSTYIFNFIQNLQNKIAKQFKNLRQYLILSLNAQDGKNYIKISLKDKLNELIHKNNNKNDYFNIKRRLNQNNIRSIIANGGCKYLCLFTDAITENIIIESNDGNLELSNKKKIGELIGAIPTAVIFVCLPKKKSLAQQLLKYCNNAKSIVFFDFHVNNFQMGRQIKKKYSHQSLTNDIITFQKMIMIESVKHIISGVIEEEGRNFRQMLYQSFVKVKNSLMFVLKYNMQTPIIKLTNEMFRQCIFLSNNLQPSTFQPNNLNLCEIEFFENQHVNKYQLMELQNICQLSFKKILKKIDKETNQLGEEEFRIQSFLNIYHFIDIFSYYLRDKYGFDQIFNINLQHVDYDIKKLFLQKLVGQNILDLIFSDKKGIIAIYVEVQNFNKYHEILIECQMELRSILQNWNAISGKRNFTKLTGGQFVANKKLNNVYIYFFEQE